MLEAIIVAVLVAAVVGFLLVVVLGPVLNMLKVPIAVFIGGILVAWGWAIGVVVGLFWFFEHGGFGKL